MGHAMRIPLTGAYNCFISPNIYNSSLHKIESFKTRKLLSSSYRSFCGICFCFFFSLIPLPTSTFPSQSRLQSSASVMWTITLSSLLAGERMPIAGVALLGSSCSSVLSCDSSMDSCLPHGEASSVGGFSLCSSFSSIVPWEAFSSSTDTRSPPSSDRHWSAQLPPPVQHPKE